MGGSSVEAGSRWRLLELKASNRHRQYGNKDDGNYDDDNNDDNDGVFLNLKQATGIDSCKVKFSDVRI